MRQVPFSRCIGALCAALAGVLVGLATDRAAAAPCPGNPQALGVSRTMVVNPRHQPRVGKFDYGRSLPLTDGEVVLTFDDGPRPPYTQVVLRALARECVRATFFMVGRMARAYPDTVRQVRAAGHTVGTHTQTHPLYRMPPSIAAREIDSGIASVAAALGSRQAVAPFFRFPGLLRTAEAERYLQSRGLMTWSIDVDSDDWRRLDQSTVLTRTLARLQRNRGGIVLMHDIQPVTALTLPLLLSELKRRGFRIVHAVPDHGAQPPVMAAAPGIETGPAPSATPKRDMTRAIAVQRPRLQHPLPNRFNVRRTAPTYVHPSQVRPWPPHPFGQIAKPERRRLYYLR